MIHFIPTEKLVKILTALWVLYNDIRPTYALEASIQCKGTRFQHIYRQIFSLTIFINNITVAHLDNDGSPLNVPNSVVNVSDVTGEFTETAIQLQASAEMECSQASRVDCEIYGYISGTDDSIYKHTRFEPHIDFHVRIQDSSIKQTLESSNDVVLSCAAIVGSNRTKLTWQSRTPRGKYTDVTRHLYNVERIRLPNCKIRVRSQLKMRRGQEGKYFRCMYGSTEVGSISVGVLDDDATHDRLPVHLFLSSILLVYAHFVILPLICSCLPKNHYIGKFRNPDNESMRMLRAWISMGVAVVLSIWWAAVITSVHSHSDYTSYLSFFLIQSFFLYVYAIIRLLSHYCEKEGDRHLYNGRVALSCGAVITPPICWILIKSQQSIPLSGLEVFWWFVTLPSLVAFVFVSHDRELKTWEKHHDL